jgi:ketosteroid isomerase-like protein
MNWILPLVFCFGCGAAGPEQELLEADRAFDLATARSGLDGWMSFFAGDAIVHSPDGPVQGTAALRNHYSRMFAQKGFSIRWQPFHAEASRDGTLGYTLGAAVISWTGADGKPARRDGRYLTVWRKQPGGRWLVVSDQGN